MTRTNTRRFKQLKADFKATSSANQTPCWICGQPIDYQAPPNDYTNPDRFELDHYYPVATHPHLQHDPANFRAAHAECNRTRGTSTNISTLNGTLSRNWTGKGQGESSK